ncbi:MAG: translation initiation factor [Bacteroidetes bacterium]|nr:translation initiation factor [Bacteroidota bacterium]
MKLRSLSDLKQILPESERNALKINIPAHTTEHSGKGKIVRVSLETAGRKGKSVTVVTGLQHNPETLEDIARILKQHCGAGGTVKDGVIEIQGDQRENISKKLRAMEYVVR